MKNQTKNKTIQKLQEWTSTSQQWMQHDIEEVPNDTPTENVTTQVPTHVPTENVPT